MKKSVVFAFGLGLGAVFGVAGGIAFVAYSAQQSPRSTTFSNVALARAPFDGDWLISWGGEDPKDNHHIGSPPQDRAVDIRKIITGSGNQTSKGDPKKNESYGCWAQPIYSPIDGIVEVAVDGVPDNIPGELNRPSAMGNYMMLKSPDGFVVVLAHFKQGSIARKAGEQVKAGDFLALCGNSGNSTEPHLHMHVQSETSMARSVALRMVFPSITVDGVQKEKYSPTRGDVISSGQKKPNQVPEPTASGRGSS
ncbi:M23 family metallopeptidase [Opitutus terrae]|uniref:Peptidase M23 n=1 Tax=Opitutus terrae (strain DSM 11246 / JCM 15787 / PB90-1) TaxID=452637 RepID=B1ZTZ9_OPITP|nr:M23 family metallopeptidase [Opitutus terrae]ACB75881.1 Peptidase M23 [Opitutus terrae PB90-1]